MVSIVQMHKYLISQFSLSGLVLVIFEFYCRHSSPYRNTISGSWVIRPVGTIPTMNKDTTVWTIWFSACCTFRQLQAIQHLYHLQSPLRMHYFVRWIFSAIRWTNFLSVSSDAEISTQSPTQNTWLNSLMGQKAIRVRGPVFWNKLPLELKLVDKFVTFKRMILCRVHELFGDHAT